MTLFSPTLFSPTGSGERSRTGSCKDPVPKKWLKDPEPGVAPLGPLILLRHLRQTSVAYITLIIKI